MSELLAAVDWSMPMLTADAGHETAQDVMVHATRLCEHWAHLPAAIKGDGFLDAAVVSLAIVQSTQMSSRMAADGEVWDADDMRQFYRKQVIRNRPLPDGAKKLAAAEMALCTQLLGRWSWHTSNYYYYYYFFEYNNT
jgi:hypothetical protein